jgi:hypothetical protein
MNSLSPVLEKRLWHERSPVGEKNRHVAMSALDQAEIRAVRSPLTLWLERVRGTDPATYWLTRFLILRLLGFVYVAAFASLIGQLLPLIGHDGLLPADLFLDRVREHAGSNRARS